MMEFVARLGTSGGEIVERSFQAENEDSLRRELDQKGFYVFSIAARSGSAGIGRLWTRRRRVPMRDFLVFNHELATLLKAGLPLLQGLDILHERMQHPLFREILGNVREQVRNGTALSDGFAAYPQYFPPLYATSLRAGERSGELEAVIRRFIAYTKIMEDVRKKVVQALIYPCILMSFSLIVVWILLTYAIPNFASMFNSFGQELPWITSLMMKASDIVRAGSLWILIFAVVAAGLFRLAWQDERVQVAVDGLKLRIPWLGSVWQKFAVSQLCRALGTLLRGGVPLVSALDVAADSIGNRQISSRVRATVKTVSEGESLSQGLERTGSLQPMVIEMVKVGESTGALAEMLENVAAYYDEDISEELQRMLTVLEPVLLIVMGTIIAGMLVSMYLPIFSLQGAIR